MNITQTILAVTLAVVSQVSAERPNIIFLLSDDQHWNETSVQMHPKHADSMNASYQTPHLEKMAANGMRFSSAYAPAPVCSPTRASIQTGMSPAALKWAKAGPPVKASGNYKLLPPESRKSLSGEVCFSSLLQEVGYATAHLGKWHIGGGGPEKNGYDLSDGDIGNEAAAKYKDPNPVDIVGMTARAAKFMETNVMANKPFYLQLSYLALHKPENASKKNIAKYAKLFPSAKERVVQRMALTTDMDEGVGVLLAHLDRLGITKNTLVIYMSDNGAGGRNKPLINGLKGNIYEGGIRAIFVAQGPGVPKASWCHERVVGYDLFPTFCKLAGVKKAIPSVVEGGDISHLLAGNQGEVKRKFKHISFHFPHYQGVAPMSAIYDGDYKYIWDYEAKQGKLFNLEKDIGEKKDLSSAEPAKALELKNALKSQLKAVDADLPKVNPNYDAAMPTDAIKRGGGKGKGGRGGRSGKSKAERG